MPDFTTLLESKILKGKYCILFVAPKINMTLENVIYLNLFSYFKNKSNNTSNNHMVMLWE